MADVNITVLQRNYIPKDENVPKKENSYLNIVFFGLWKNDIYNIHRDSYFKDQRSKMFFKIMIFNILGGKNTIRRSHCYLTAYPSPPGP